MSENTTKVATTKGITKIPSTVISRRKQNKAAAGTIARPDNKEAGARCVRTFTLSQRSRGNNAPTPKQNARTNSAPNHEVKESGDIGRRRRIVPENHLSKPRRVSGGKKAKLIRSPSVQTTAE